MKKHNARHEGYQKFVRERAERWATTLSKFCKGCKQDVSTDNFRKRVNNLGITIPRARCKDCERKDAHKSRYANYDRYEIRRVKYLLRKIGVEDVEAMYEYIQTLPRQCQICNRHEKDLSRSLVIDHCHNTNKVRGLLCDRCNRSIGQFEDNVELLQNAIKYIETHRE